MGERPDARRAVSSEIRQRAKELRREQTVAEEKLWTHVRNRALMGHKFRRQYPIENFIVDLCCPDKKLMIEVHGPTHEGREDYDRERAKRLSEMGYRVLRFKNEDVLLNIDGVLETIVRELSSPSP